MGGWSAGRSVGVRGQTNGHRVVSMEQQKKGMIKTMVSFELRNLENLILNYKWEFFITSSFAAYVGGSARDKLPMR